MYSIKDAITELKTLSQNKLLNEKLPEEDFLRKLELRIGMSIHKDFKKLLTEAGNINYGTLQILNVNPDLEDKNELEMLINEIKKSDYFDKAPRDGIPICYDNGDCYFILPNGKVVFWSHDGLNNEQWQSLASWVKEVWIGGN